MAGGEGSNRKIRADKKKPIAPYIPDRFRVWIHRISRRCDLPEGDVGLQLIRTALMDEECVRFFWGYFKRDFIYSEVISFVGHTDARSVYDYIDSAGERDRFKVKPSQAFYDQLCEFQYALGISYLAHATHALLQYALHDLKTIQKVCPGIQLSEITGPQRPLVDTTSAGNGMLSFALAKQRPASSDRSSSTVWSILK